MIAPLPATFAALADPTRLAILARLAQGEAGVNDLAALFPISQPAMKTRSVRCRVCASSTRTAQNRTQAPT